MNCLCGHDAVHHPFKAVSTLTGPELVVGGCQRCHCRRFRTETVSREFCSSCGRLAILQSFEGRRICAACWHDKNEDPR